MATAAGEPLEPTRPETVVPLGVRVAVQGEPGPGGPVGPTQNSNARLDTEANQPEWLQYVPERIKHCVTWERSEKFEVPEGAILLPYTGSRDVWIGDQWWKSLDEMIEEMDSETAAKVIAIDKDRDPRLHDMTQKEPYNSLCTAAAEGKIQQAGGGPNCRTWSVLRLIKLLSGKGLPCRGRTEETCWGLPELQREGRKDDRETTDQDSVLLVRLMHIIWLAHKAGTLKAAWLEHPADPAGWSEIQGAENCCSVWVTKAMRAWMKELGMKQSTFDQKEFGGLATKWTTIAHSYKVQNVPEGKQERLHYRLLNTKANWWDHQWKYKGESRSLARYPRRLMMALAEEIIYMDKRTSENKRRRIGEQDYVILTAGETMDRKSEAKRGSPTVGIQAEMITMGFRQRPIRDGAGKPSPGRMTPDKREVNQAAANIGVKVYAAVRRWEAQIHKNDAKKSKNSKESPIPKELIKEVMEILADGEDTSIEDGQPLRLKVLRKMLQIAGDPDADFTLELAKGLPLGVEELVLNSPGVWPTKEEMRLAPAPEEDDTMVEMHDCKNYQSAEQWEMEIEKTYQDERKLGMTTGPWTEEEAAKECGCEVGKLKCGAMGAVEELDKIRPIYDATKSGININIRRHCKERTTAPTLADAIHANRWSLNNLGWQDKKLKKAHLPKRGQRGKRAGCRPSLCLLKSDVSKAHRRCKILQKDWRYQVARVRGKFWVNKVGTYGVASAQHYWGRTVALVVRLLYVMFPAVDWIMVFVDDIIVIHREDYEELSWAIMATLEALGYPMAWNKTERAPESSWVGFAVNLPKHEFSVLKPKLDEMVKQLRHWQGCEYMQFKMVESTLGRLQWTTGACPTIKPFMEPMWRWKKVLGKAGGRPSKTTAWIAMLAEKMLSQPYRPSIKGYKKSIWHGSSDAGAKIEQKKAGIGGWISNIAKPEKGDVWWFMSDMMEKHNRWLYEDKDPQRRIAALELLGTLVLFRQLVRHAAMEGGRLDLHFELETDNQGNQRSIMSEKNKNWPNSALLMALVWEAHKEGAEIGINHTKREQNTWADQLAGLDATGFDPAKELKVKTNPEEWEILETLINLRKE